MQSFKGRPFLLRQLMRPVETGRIVHAQIFYGLKGSGRTTAALLMSRALNCMSSGVKPCEKCPACRRILEGIAPEIIYVKPEDTSSIKIEPVRDMLDGLAVAPDRGYKCVIITPADRMTTQAQNALLKTLEEPPEHAVFFLITDNLADILPTIRSRCLLTRFAPVSTQDVYDAVDAREGNQHSEKSDIRFAASASGGLIGKALDILHDKEYKEFVDSVCGVIDGIKQPNGVSNGTLVFGGLKNKCDQLLFMFETAAEELLRGECSYSISKHLKNQKIAPMTVLNAVIACRQRLDNNVAYQYAIDMFLFELSASEDY